MNRRIQGNDSMKRQISLLRGFLFGRSRTENERARRAQRATLLCETLEGRVAPAHFHGVHHALIAIYGQQTGGRSESHSTTAQGMIASSAVGASAPSATSRADRTRRTQYPSQRLTLASALKALMNEIQIIKLGSTTTIGQLTAIEIAMRTLSAGGLSPSSTAVLESFEDRLVTASASGTILENNLGLLRQFEALYTSSPTTQETADLTVAYNALIAAVMSAGITAADISTINAGWSAVQAAQGNPSTTAFPFFTLVTGRSFVGQA
jgi:hypothetical protein